MRYGIALVLLLGGCCWTAKRSCFPPCPPQVVKTVKVERPCQLPPKLKLPKVVRTPCTDSQGEEMVCFDRRNGALLAKRQADMKDWIKEARARCEPTSQNMRSRLSTPPPTSQPAATP